MSEMLHTEVGMAVALGRPVLAFVLDGTDVGNFLPQAVQYISLKPSDNTDLQVKLPLIGNYCRSALAMIQERWLQEDRSGLLKAGLYGFAAIGAVTILRWFQEE